MMPTGSACAPAMASARLTPLLSATEVKKERSAARAWGFVPRAAKMPPWPGGALITLATLATRAAAKAFWASICPAPLPPASGTPAW
jgi:hypothetical protein